MLSSILIHEFGHLKLFKKERIFEGLEAEIKANQYGKEGLPPELLPTYYDEYRAFALRSYEKPEEWQNKKQWEQQYEKWVKEMTNGRSAIR
jgi:hypothetical protein